MIRKVKIDGLYFSVNYMPNHWARAFLSLATEHRAPSSPLDGLYRPNSKYFHLPTLFSFFYAPLYNLVNLYNFFYTDEGQITKQLNEQNLTFRPLACREDTHTFYIFKIYFIAPSL